MMYYLKTVHYEYFLTHRLACYTFLQEQYLNAFFLFELVKRVTTAVFCDVTPYKLVQIYRVLEEPLWHSG